MSRKVRIFFSAGEPSGDIHAANLIRALKAENPDFEAVGYGGPMMEEAGCKLHTDLTALAVMWLLRVLVNLHKFYGLISRAERYFRDEKPDAVVLIDYPGFNWWIAKKAKKHGIPVIYYCPPQIWAWASWRIKKMRRYVDHVLCCLPFEAKWFKERGCNATFVGHPFFDEVTMRSHGEAFIKEQKKKKGRLVVLLPGSRTQEVRSNFEYFVRAAVRVHEKCPDVRFAVAAYKPHQATMCRHTIEEELGPSRKLPIEVYTRQTNELIRLAHCCMSVSGSVSLELLANTRPTVILYKISRFEFWVQSFFKKVKYITLVNLLTTDELFPEDLSPYDPGQPDADRVLFPEYLTFEDKSKQVADHLIEWLTDEEAYGRRVADLEQLRDDVCHGGAALQAARYILKQLKHGTDTGEHESSHAA